MLCSAQSLSCVRLFAAPWTVATQDSYEGPWMEDGDCIPWVI